MEVTPIVMTCATNRRDFPLDIQDADEERRWLLWDVILCASTSCFGAPLAPLAAPTLKWHVDERLWRQWIVRLRQKCLGSFPQWLQERLVPFLMSLTLRCVWIP
ncbi:hypothetical protein ACFX2C_014881 [Malus domestica]